jgi:hypothetical protein
MVHEITAGQVIELIVPALAIDATYTLIELVPSPLHRLALQTASAGQRVLLTSAFISARYDRRSMRTGTAASIANIPLEWLPLSPRCGHLH